jgi:hypothetical protein
MKVKIKHWKEGMESKGIKSEHLEDKRYVVRLNLNRSKILGSGYVEKLSKDDSCDCECGNDVRKE